MCSPPSCSASARRASRRRTSSRPPAPSIGAAAAATRWSPWSSATAFWVFAIPNGIRPLVLGERDTSAAPSGCWPPRASRSTCCASTWCATWRRARRCSSTSRAGCTRSSAWRRCATRPCIFEYVYFARPDSIIDNISVYRARMRMGERLAEKILRERPDHDIDVVIPIPGHQPHQRAADGAAAGRQVSRGLHQEPLHRPHLHHAGPGTARAKSVRRKLNAIDLEFRGKNVLLVDDSIVRGTTSAQIIELAREAGAKKVYFASAAPPVRYPERLRHRHAGGQRAGGGRPHRRGSVRHHRRRLAHLPGSWRIWSARLATTMRRSRSSTPPASRASTSPAT